MFVINFYKFYCHPSGGFQNTKMSKSVNYLYSNNPKDNDEVRSQTYNFLKGGGNILKHFMFMNPHSFVGNTRSENISHKMSFKCEKDKEKQLHTDYVC